MLKKVALCPLTWILVAALLVIFVPSCTARGDEMYPTPAEPVLYMSPDVYTYIDGIKPPVMPLVDPSALDNRAEDVIQTYAPGATSENPHAFYILVNFSDDEYDRVAGRIYNPLSEKLLYLLGVNVVPKNKHIIRVPNGYKLFGKYELHRHGNTTNDYYMLYSSQKERENGTWTHSWRLGY
jgi:hypothetical protein